MSLSWTRRSEWLLAPGFVEEAAGHSVRRVECPWLDGEPWRAAFDALAGELRSAEKRSITVVLSNHFVRYLVVPWRDDLRSPAERDGFARHLFAESFGGERSGDWDIRVAPEPGGAPRLASAIDAGLVAALREQCEPTSGRLVSLQPLLMNAFNAWRKRAGMGDAWFAVFEPGRLCLALISGGRWRSVANVRAGGDPEMELQALLPLERARAAASGAESDTLFVCSRGGCTLRSLRISGARVEMLGAVAGNPGNGGTSMATAA